MIKGQVYSYAGMNQDVSKEKFPYQFYYEAGNIRIIDTDSQSKYSATNERGNSLSVDLPAISISTANNTIETRDENNVLLQTIDYVNGGELDTQVDSGILPAISGHQTIIGNAVTRNSIVLFSTDSNGFDCIWRVRELLEGNFNLELTYCRNLGLSTANPIQALFNYENERLQKVYWVDGTNQLRFINLEHSIENGDVINLIDVSSNTLNTVGNFDLSQPIIVNTIGGGTHTAGKIQYVYTLYRLNGSETTISPLSELIALDKGDGFGGGALNEPVSTSPIVRIENLDTEYTNIRIYSLKYTSFNVIPQISLIVDQEVTDFERFDHTDSGNIIRSLTLPEFLFLGGNPVIPRHISSKDNTLFAANLTETDFDIDIDMRAFQFPINNVNTAVYDNVSLNSFGRTIGSILFLNGDYNVPERHDSINLDFTNRRYQFNSSIEGGEGKYVRFELLQLTESQLRASGRDVVELQFFKDAEIYRIGIQFYNVLGQKSFPKWISDFQAPVGNLEGNYNALRVTLKPEFYTKIDSMNLSPNDSPVGYKILRTDRTVNDRTILCQGMLTGMMIQTTRDVANFGFWLNETNRRDETFNKIMTPWLFTREFNNDIRPLLGAFNYAHINETGFGESNDEIYRDDSRGSKRQQSWLYTGMYQMHSPDVVFDTSISFNNDNRLRILGGLKRTELNTWHKVRSFETLSDIFDNKRNDVVDYGSVGDWRGYGLMGTPFERQEIRFTQTNSKYETFIRGSRREYAIYGKPEVAERSQGVTRYNNDVDFSYVNTVRGIISDEKDFRDAIGAITSVNSNGERCVNIVEGAENVDKFNRKDLATLRDGTGIPDTDITLLAEITRPISDYHTGLIYGGVTFAAKSRSSYIEIGSYTDINDNVTTIYSPGDTYVNTYRFARITRDDVDIENPNTYNLTEILEHKCETTIDLKNRNDNSIDEWDSIFQPRYDEAFAYNNVYSQQPNLIRNQALDFNFRKVNQFDVRIQASRVKIPGENIDSWTDFLANEFMDLDGKYGPINALVGFKDDIYALQDIGVVYISINPRIQIPGGDGLEFQLGTGRVLDDYKYVSTTSGTINKWSVFESPTGFYYFDAFNKAMCKFPNNLDNHLSDQFGMHTFFNNLTNYNIIVDDNPILKRGVSGIYNLNTDDAYMSIHQGDRSFTIAFNERANAFSSLYSYVPSIYIVKGSRMLTTHPDNNRLYEHFTGDYGNFYGTVHPSYITYHAGTNEKRDCIFNNMEYRHEVYNGVIDVPNETLTSVRVNNEYLDTGTVPLVLNSNIKRKFRIWRANLPRVPGLRDRVRGQWCFVRVEFDNVNNRRMILHDMTIYYTLYP